MSGETTIGNKRGINMGCYDNLRNFLKLYYPNDTLCMPKETASNFHYIQTKIHKDYIGEMHIEVVTSENVKGDLYIVLHLIGGYKKFKDEFKKILNNKNSSGNQLQDSVDQSKGEDGFIYHTIHNYDDNNPKKLYEVFKNLNDFTNKIGCYFDQLAAIAPFL